MALLSTIRFLGALPGAALVVLAGGCTAPGDSVPCPRREAAFRLQLTAPGAAVPSDMAVEVTYQGSETETFSLSPGGAQNEDVCCRLGVPTNGVLPHVSCLKNPPAPALDASSARDAGQGQTGGGIGDAAAGQVPPSGGRDARSSTDGGNLLDASRVEPPGVGSRQTALLCELLTNGPATIHVTAKGYRPLDQELQSKLREDHCGVQTVDVHLTLLGPDGGSL